MPRNDEDLSETDIRHPDSQMQTVRAAELADGRPWMDEAVVCQLLGQYRIVHLGIGRMLAPFEIVRTALGGSYFLSCFGGLGEVLVNGRWEPCGPGQAFLLSPGTLHAFRTVAGGQWDFCWVRYRERAGEQAIVGRALRLTFELPDPSGVVCNRLALHLERSLKRDELALQSAKLLDQRILPWRLKLGDSVCHKGGRLTWIVWTPSLGERGIFVGRRTRTRP